MKWKRQISPEKESSNKLWYVHYKKRTNWSYSGAYDKVTNQCQINETLTKIIIGTPEKLITKKII